MADQEHWQWQEPGTAWKGAALYHLTLTVTDRQPLLGRLVTPDGNPAKAWVVRTPFGDALVDCLMNIPQYHPEVQVLHFCLMPDHLHAVLYVRRSMPKGIATVARGFWQGTRKLGRACSLPPSFMAPPAAPPASSPAAPPSSSPAPPSSSPAPPSSFLTPNSIRGELQEETRRLEAFSASLCRQIGSEAYYRLPSVFAEMPFLRPMSRRTQLQNTIRYIDMNPQRLATKRLFPGFFRVQQGITIGPRSYDGVGNAALLMEKAFAPVHVSHTLVDQAAQGDDQPLRNYKNSCVLKARQGVVMVSPFISPHEKQVQQVLLREHLLFILLADNGFREYYKPADSLFDACAAGRMLILSPWPYDAGKRHITRADCVALNAMAEEICQCLNATTDVP